MRGEYKTPGGKLVGVNVVADAQGDARSCTIDGDFFIEAQHEGTADKLLMQLEQALISGTSLSSVLERFPDVQLIGVDASAIEQAFARAIRAIHSSDQHDVDVHDVHGDVAAQPDARHRRHVPLPDADIIAMWRERWPKLNLAVIHDHPRAAQEQMDVDELWARQVAAGARQPTLRLWEWAQSAVVIGRFQSLDDEVDARQAAAEHVHVVRRCTGGGAMFIEPGNTITYTLYAPLDFVQGVSVADSYRLCDQWLVRALRSLGLDVRFSGLNDIASQHGKIGGAAQRRFPSADGGPGCVLHHVTMAYDIDAVKMGRILNTSQEKMSDKAVHSAVRRVDPLRSQTGRSREELVELLLSMVR